MYLEWLPYIFYWEGGAQSVPPRKDFPTVLKLTFVVRSPIRGATYSPDHPPIILSPYYHTMASQKGTKGCTLECPSSCNNNTDNSSDGNDIEDLIAPSPAAAPLLLRSQGWYDANVPSKDHIYHRSWLQNQGHPTHLLDGTHPIIAVSPFSF